MLHSTHEDCVAEDSDDRIHVYFVELGKISLKCDDKLVHFEVGLLQTRYARLFYLNENWRECGFS